MQQMTLSVVLLCYVFSREEPGCLALFLYTVTSFPGQGEPGAHGADHRRGGHGGGGARAEETAFLAAAAERRDHRGAEVRTPRWRNARPHT